MQSTNKQIPNSKILKAFGIYCLGFGIYNCLSKYQMQVTYSILSMSGFAKGIASF